MEYMSNKALIIAVSLFVTMAIASAVLLIVNQVMSVYKEVYETDTLIQSSFDEFDAYDSTVKTKLDLLNVAKKYIDSDIVYVTTKKKDDINKFNLDAIKTERINNKESVEFKNIKSSLEEKIETENSSSDVGTIYINSTEAAKKYNSYVLKFDNIVVICFNEIRR